METSYFKCHPMLTSRKSLGINTIETIKLANKVDLMILNGGESRISREERQRAPLFFGEVSRNLHENENTRSKSHKY